MTTKTRTTAGESWTSFPYHYDDDYDDYEYDRRSTDIKVQVADDEVIIVLSNLMPNGKQVGTEMAGIIKRKVLQ